VVNDFCYEVIITEGPTRSRTKYTITSREVHDRAASTLQRHIQLTDHGPKCRASLLITILLYAASRITSVFDACQRLAGAPSDQALRDALRATLPSISVLEQRLNAGLAADLPKALRKRRYPMAIDLTLLPYHGEPFRSPLEIYRGDRDRLKSQLLNLTVLASNLGGPCVAVPTSRWWAASAQGDRMGNAPDACRCGTADSSSTAV